ncbi:MAG: peptide chain release factor N(5)-glutamine methyltransferase [Chloroflexi bacterium]|nr:peptide chain release factor N(5)-glutamine methyltransferase [Chloroflexota bacterium]
MIARPQKQGQEHCDTPRTVRQASVQVAATLKRHGIPDSNLEAEVLVRHALNWDRAQFYASLSESLQPASVDHVQAITSHRLSGEPLAYITGHREFYGLELSVNSAVLIPRQETELLVDAALDYARTLDTESITIADVGTGSGAIAVALAAHLPNAQVFAIDSSSDALTVAEQNRRKHGLVDRVCPLQGDLLAPLQHSVDIIVSNPPYISSDLIAGLSPEVRHEPRQALDGGKDGREVIRRLLRQAPSKLNAGGCALIEISPEQSDAAHKTAREQFPRADISVLNDLLGLPRCLVVRT